MCIHSVSQLNPILWATINYCTISHLQYLNDPQYSFAKLRSSLVAIFSFYYYLTCVDLRRLIVVEPSLPKIVCVLWPLVIMAVVMTNWPAECVRHSSNREDKKMISTLPRKRRPRAAGEGIVVEESVWWICAANKFDFNQSAAIGKTKVITGQNWK